MTKYSRITGKVFGAAADPTGDNPQIGQFGSALAGTYNGTSDVTEIQNLAAWDNGFIGCVTPTTQFPPLPEMTGFGKVLSQQICYLLQQGIAEYDSGTTYYIGNWVSYNSSIYVAKSDGFSNQLPTNTTYWNKFTGGSSRNYGEYVTSSLPLTDNTLHLANGALLSQTDYPEFYSYVANLYNSLPSGEFTVAAQSATLGNNTWISAAFGDNKFVAVNYNGQYSVSLDNCVTWSTPATMVSGTTKQTAIAYGNGIFVCATEDGKILTSPDGVNWNLTTSINPIYQRTGLTFAKNKFYLIELDGLIEKSDDGSSWTVVAQLGASQEGWYSIESNGESLVALSQSGYISTSEDGENWTTAIQNANLHSAGNFEVWRNMTFDGYKYTAISQSGYISYATDGTDWTVPVQNSNLGNNTWHSLTYGNFKIFALSSTGYTSTKEVPFTDVFITEADWQAEYATYGECGKYVYNSGANTVRIPAVNSYFTNTTNTQKAGDLTPASIPNIRGTVNHLIMQTEATFNWQGAFYDAGIGGDSYKPSSTTKVADNKDNIGLDASRSSSVYSDSATTVNTQSIKQLVYIVVRK